VIRPHRGGSVTVAMNDHTAGLLTEHRDIPPRGVGPVQCGTVQADAISRARQ